MNIFVKCTKVCRYNWLNAGLAISNAKTHFKNQFIVLFIVIFRTLSFPMVMDIFIGCVNTLKQSVVLLITLQHFLL